MGKHLCLVTVSLIGLWAGVSVASGAEQRPAEVDYDRRGVPSDAIRLFDGTNLGMWRNMRGGAATWPILADGSMRVDKTGNTATSVVASVYTKAEFASFQLHLEFLIPESAKAMWHPQWRGNSGVKVFGCYEVQVLGSKGQETEANTLCGAIYERSAPLVVASRPFGQWESYDIIFHAPIVNDGIVVCPARFSVLQNGVLVQDNASVLPYPDTPENRLKTRGCIELQSHNDPSEGVRYRNIWIRKL